MEITLTPTIIILFSFITGNTYDGPLKSISEFNLIAAAVNGNGIIFIDATTGATTKTFTAVPT